MYRYYRALSSRNSGMTSCTICSQYYGPLGKTSGWCRLRRSVPPGEWLGLPPAP